MKFKIPHKWICGFLDRYDRKVHNGTIDPKKCLKHLLCILKLSAPAENQARHTDYYDYIYRLNKCRMLLKHEQYDQALAGLSYIARIHGILQKRILCATIALLEQYI